MRPASEKRRREILDAALDCFAARGYAATTLEEIRLRSGASTGSIYHLFKSKEEIGGIVYLEAMRDWQDGFLAVLRAEAGAEAAVRATVAYYLDWIGRSPKLARFILNTRQAELLPAVRDQIRAQNRAFVVAIVGLIEPYIAKGRLRAMPLELFTAMVMGPVMEYGRQWLAGTSKTPPERALPLLADGAWAAVRAR